VFRMRNTTKPQMITAVASNAPSTILPNRGFSRC